MLEPSLVKNDRKAKILIWTVSIIVFVAVVILSKVKLVLNLPFNVHVFATFNAVVNSMVALLLLAGLVTAKSKNYAIHKKNYAVCYYPFSIFFTQLHLSSSTCRRNKIWRFKS